MCTVTVGIWLQPVRVAECYVIYPFTENIREWYVYWCKAWEEVAWLCLHLDVDVYHVLWLSVTSHYNVTVCKITIDINKQLLVTDAGDLSHQIIISNLLGNIKGVYDTKLHQMMKIQFWWVWNKPSLPLLPGPHLNCHVVGGRFSGNNTIYNL